MPPPKLKFPGFEKSGGENASHMDLGGGGGEHIYIYIYVYIYIRICTYIYIIYMYIYVYMCGCMYMYMTFWNLRRQLDGGSEGRFVLAAAYAEAMAFVPKP